MPDREQIYIEYVDKVRRYVKGKIQNQQEVEDLVSSIFVKVYQNISSFDRKKASISTWIYTITRNTVIDYFKAHKIVCELPEILEYTEEGFEDVLKKETLDELAEALEQLEQRKRDLIILHYYSGYTLKQTAEKMQMSYANAKIMHTKALRELKKLMAW